MSDDNPFAAMMKLGQDWAAQMNPAMTSFASKGVFDMFPTMSKDMMETFFGKGLNPGGLDAKTRLMLTLTGLTITGAQAETQIRATVRHLSEAGATRKEIAEVIAQAGLFGGVPAMTQAMTIATEELSKDDNA
ncbi:carboxymuconolactone decarboxylase family protein [Loktanella sp. SALINAS62]|uniref:carboxymuconolactone decarboxylase family protein n=1 Tax=Loktanella sp. SALINAS62 TaxID=2706124 RepID=UPI001B8D362A|nr:carboxymuconolactone decarboxylase family protein [Loktanella sp. SALINAS62]MBS1304201.1 carboxymuconolactone decarboxylase family protein [Loktanella sp. SALINAS62]